MGFADFEYIQGKVSLEVRFTNHEVAAPFKFNNNNNNIGICRDVIWIFRRGGFDGGRQIPNNQYGTT